MKPHLLSLLILLIITLLPSLSLSAAEEAQVSPVTVPLVVDETQPLALDELAALSVQSAEDVELQQLRGGADKEFWKAFGIGAGVLLLVIIIL